MKNRILVYLSFFMVLGLLVSACETEIERANAEYDWDAVTPVVLGVSGPTSVLQTFTEMFSVSYYRAGSTWEWTVVSGGATIESTSEDGHEAYVTFSDMGEVVIAVTETAANGKVSESFSYDPVTVNEFCPVALADFLGTWSGTESIDGGDPEAISVTFVAGATEDEIIVEASEGTPGFQSAIFLGWGETFQAGFGNEGDIVLNINENGTLDINWAYWGQTLPGPYDYWYFGSGLWDGCGAAPTMSISFNMDWNGDSSAPETAYGSLITLTKE